MDTLPVNKDAIRFYLVRHGETRENQEGILQGQGEGELNRVGLQQAAALAEAFYRIPLDACHASDLPRALDSARVILAAGHRKVTLQPETGLREWALGKWEGRPSQELQEHRPEIFHAFRLEPQEEVPVPGGESPRQFRERLWECMGRLASLHRPGEQVLLVTHGAALGKIFQLATGRLFPENRIPLPDNASVSILHFHPREKAWELVAWNQTAHLKGLPRHPTRV